MYKWHVGLNCLLSCFKKNTQIPEILKITDDRLLHFEVFCNFLELRYAGPVRVSLLCNPFCLREEFSLVFVGCGLLLPDIW